MLEKKHRSAVLVVEDEPLVRMVMVEVLEEAGFKVVEAATGEAGLLELERDPDLKVLLTDIEMPGKLNGLALARIMHERCPDAAVVVMSGRIRPGVSELPPNARFFNKPYRHDEIVAALHELLRTRNHTARRLLVRASASCRTSTLGSQMAVLTHANV